MKEGGLFIIDAKCDGKINNQPIFIIGGAYGKLSEYSIYIGRKTCRIVFFVKNIHGCPGIGVKMGGDGVSSEESGFTGTDAGAFLA
jgi:hypothetical protein